MLPIDERPIESEHSLPVITNESWLPSRNSFQNAIFNHKFLKQLLYLFSISQHCRTDQLLLVGLCLLVIVSLFVGYQVILIPGRIYQALIDDNKAKFISEIRVLFLLSMLITLIKVLRTACQSVLSNRARKWVTERLDKQYLSDEFFYHLENSSPSIDNPDQRIVSDVEQLFEKLYETLVGRLGSGGMVEALITIIWYSIQTFRRCGLIGIVVAYVWSLLVSGMDTILVNVVSPWLYRQEMLQAWFRFLHIDLRRNAEYIVFQGSSEFERHRLYHSLESLISNRYRIIYRQLSLNSCQIGFGYLVTIVMYGTIGMILFFPLGWSTIRDADKAEWIAQTSGIFISLLYGFTSVVQEGTNLSNLVPCTTRIGQFSECMDSYFERNQEKDWTSPHDDLIAVQNLELKTSDGKNLLSNVHFDVRKGESLLLCGPSGIGKTSILRCVAGLWKPCHGRIFRPIRKDTFNGGIFFIPDHPYFPPNSSLRQQIKYPMNHWSYSISQQIKEDQEMDDLLALVQLKHLKQRVGSFDRAMDFSNCLSAGEKQRLCFARALFHQPEFIIMDEAISYLDQQAKMNIFHILKGRGIGFITVSHDEELKSMHDRIVYLSKPNTERE